jgi:transposase
LATESEAVGLVTVGVDTHVDVHVAVALDQLGRRLGSLTFPTSPAGYGSWWPGSVDWAPWSGWGLKAPGASGPASPSGYGHRE